MNKPTSCLFPDVDFKKMGASTSMWKIVCFGIDSLYKVVTIMKKII